MNQSGYSALNRSHYLVILAIIVFILTAILLILYLFNVPDKHKNIPWKYIELAYCLFSTLLLGIFSLYLVMYEYNTKLLIVGGVSIAKQKEWFCKTFSCSCILCRLPSSHIWYSVTIFRISVLWFDGNVCLWSWLHLEINAVWSNWWACIRIQRIAGLNACSNIFICEILTWIN